METKHYRSGWDCFTPAPGTVEEMDCLVCGERMEVRRDVIGPTSSVEAMAQRKHPHDTFTCPNSGKDWHNQALAIRQVIQKTPSRILASILEAEVAEIIRTEICTKNDYGFFV